MGGDGNGTRRTANRMSAPQRDWSPAYTAACLAVLEDDTAEALDMLASSSVSAPSRVAANTERGFAMPDSGTLQTVPALAAATGLDTSVDTSTLSFAAGASRSLGELPEGELPDCGPRRRDDLRRRDDVRMRGDARSRSTSRSRGCDDDDDDPGN